MKFNYLSELNSMINDSDLRALERYILGGSLEESLNMLPPSGEVHTFLRAIHAMKTCPPDQKLDQVKEYKEAMV